VIPRGLNDDGVSGAIGAIFLIVIVVAGMAILMVAVISQPQPQKIPVMSAEIVNTTTELYLKHDGGDTLQRGEFKILVDGQDKTAAFGDPATWSIGQSLEYSGYDPQNIPGTIQIVYTGGSYGQTIEQLWVNPPTLTVSPTTTTTNTTTATPTETPTPVPAPVANFTGTPLTGAALLTVQFTDLSTNSPTSWAWNFGDGNFTGNTTQNPTHLYTSSGTYTVTLNATNAAGSNTFSRTGYIVVTQVAPVANFTGIPLTGAAPLTVQFTDLSTNSPTSWAWNFGDGNFTGNTTQNPTHLYTSSGTYTVNLTATNAAGSNTVSETSYITVTGSSFANFIVNQNVFVYGSQLNFAGNTVNGPGATIVITGPLSVSTLQGGASLAVSTIYVNGDTDFSNAGGQTLGSASSPGVIYVNGNMNIGSGMGNVYGNVYIAKSLTLSGGQIHGSMYVNGDLTLGYTPTLDSTSYIYYTGSLSYPQGYSQAILAKCINVASVPAVTMPSQTIAPPQSAAWYAARGYVSGGTLTSNMKIFASSYSSNSWGSSASNVVIVASNGDITLNQGYGAITGVLYAPNGKVTFSGNSFTGVVIASNGFYVTSGGTTVTFTNLASYFSSPDDYPF
jgi:PKD repeat protein